MRLIVDALGPYLYLKVDDPSQGYMVVRRLIGIRGWMTIGKGEWQVPLSTKAFEAILDAAEALEADLVLVPGMTNRVLQKLSEVEEMSRPPAEPLAPPVDATTKPSWEDPSGTGKRGP
ncbi:MAG: hypothetical protein QN198_08345 [Armatimonadota bacterium]|nr:hypothetical protein [Armatimonadota bacterium]MDR5703599.1 hypothetical protein [Armatimonadota bacterium]MDR7435381.1 hypothetical protein [Armatimonadota bacterium]